MRKVAFIALLLCLAGVFSPGLDAVRGQSGLGADLQVAQLLDQIEAGSARKTRVEGELLSLAGQRDDRRNRLKQRVRALYRITRAGVAPMAGGLEAVLGHVARVKRLERIVTRDAHELRGVDSRTQQLRGEASELGRSLEQARAQLGSAQQMQALGRDPAGDRFLGTFGGSAEAAQDAPEAQGFYGLRVLGDAPGGDGFTSKRGSLGMPVSGEVRVRDARRDESDGPGLEFEVAAGTAVRAVENGRVAFSDTYGSYGRLVILDHGEGYYTVYGGLGSVEVRVGDDVSRRARIASVGSDANPPALFFEVRQGTRTLSPRSWLGM
jgi:murein DD-endopeptidase MepM/ murein hydrolase activator NlpD